MENNNDQKIVKTRVVLNETGHTMNELRTDINLDEEGKVADVQIYEPRPLPIPSVSTIKQEQPEGEFDMTDAINERIEELRKFNPNIDPNAYVYEIKSFPDFKDKSENPAPTDLKKTYDELFKEISTQAQTQQVVNGQNRGTCVHRQLEHYASKHEIVGCMCPHKSYWHYLQFKHWKTWFDKFVKDHDIVEVHTEVVGYIRNGKGDIVWTGIFDVQLIGADGTIYWGDWKTTAKMHPVIEPVQILSYRYLQVHNFDVNFDKEKFFVYNTNQFPDGMSAEEAKKLGRDYKEKTGYFRLFTVEHIKTAIQDTIKDIISWNQRPIKERLQMSINGWNDDEIADAHLEQYGEDDLRIPLPDNFQDKLDGNFDTKATGVFDYSPEDITLSTMSFDFEK